MKLKNLITQNSLNLMTKVVTINIAYAHNGFFFPDDSVQRCKEFESQNFLPKGFRKGFKASLLQMSWIILHNFTFLRNKEMR